MKRPYVSTPKYRRFFSFRRKPLWSQFEVKITRCRKSCIFFSRQISWEAQQQERGGYDVDGAARAGYKLNMTDCEISTFLLAKNVWCCGSSFCWLPPLPPPLPLLPPLPPPLPPPPLRRTLRRATAPLLDKLSWKDLTNNITFWFSS